MKDIIYYGVGQNLKNYGKDFLQETGQPVCLVDKNENLHNTKVLVGGKLMPIFSLQYAMEHYPDADYYITLADHNIPDVYDYLKFEGILKEKMHFFGGKNLQSILRSREEAYQDREQYIPHQKLFFEVHLTEHCNLNCIACGHFSSIAEKEFLDPKEYEMDCQRLAELFDKEVSRVYLTGGETLLHPQVTEFMQITRQYFEDARICVFTNGILIPSMENTFWEAAQKYKIEIITSEYPNIDYKRVETCCDSHYVRYEGVRPEANINTRYFIDENGNGDCSANFYSCYQANRCITLKHGRIYPCVTAAHASLLKKRFNLDITLSDENSIDIYSVQNGRELLQKLVNPISFCCYCNTKAAELYFDDWRISSSNPYEWIAFNWSKRDFEWLCLHKNIYVYGEGRWGKDAVMRLQRENIPIAGIFWDNPNQDGLESDGIKIMEISDFKCAKKDDVCILAVEGNSRKEIQRILYGKGFCNLVPIIRKIPL